MSTQILPKEITQAVRAHIPRNLQHYAFKVVGAVWLKYHRDKIPLLEYTPLAQNYFAAVLGTWNGSNMRKDGQQVDVGKKAIGALIAAGILESDGRGYLAPRGKKKGVCRNYRIAPALVGADLELLQLATRRRQGVKLSQIEAAARRQLEQIRLPFDTFEEIAAWTADFVRTPEQQQRIADRITAGPADPQYYPKSAHLLLDSGAEVILRPFILAYLRCGLRLWRYTSKTGRKTYFLAKYDDLLRWKTDQLAASFAYQLAVVNSVRAVDQVAHRNATNERLDTPLTNLFSKFLALVTVRGEHLAGIDLSNSQFVLFAGILAAALDLVDNYPATVADFLSNNSPTNAPRDSTKTHLFSGKPWTPCDMPKTHLDKPFFQLPKQTQRTLLSYLWHIRSVTNCKSGVQLKSKNAAPLPEIQGHAGAVSDRSDVDPFADLRAFIQVCTSGRLYEYIAAKKFFKRDLDRLNADQLRAVRNIHRDQAKQAMFALFFDRYHAHKRKAEKAADRDVLTAVFPHVVGIVDHVKKCAVVELKRRKKADPEKYAYLYTKDGELQTPDHVGNAWFSVMLQRVESKIFVDGILRKAMRRHWAASKHDSILCLQSDFDRVLRIVRGELDKVLGAGNYRLKRQTFGMDADGRPQTTEEPIEPKKT